MAERTTVNKKPIVKILCNQDDNKRPGGYLPKAWKKVRAKRKMQKKSRRNNR